MYIYVYISYKHRPLVIPFHNLVLCTYTVNIIIVDYVHKIQHESLNLRQKYPTLKKAKLNSKQMLPKEPMSLASMYRNGNQPESKESIVARDIADLPNQHVL